ncbi:response regulator transcription factor [Roseiflexus sp.]|uniref:response regulator transcription factor n=1 Tax=Roseiflexus sp. TaxID=2562120 RepID=UPI00398A7F54
MEGGHGVPPLIMLVEDNDLIVECVEIHLRREMFSVITATGYTEAVQLLHNHTPGLIVLDLILDDGNGYDLCRTLRTGGNDGEFARIADIPILILSACADEDDRLEGFRAGADDYITKPFSPAELIFRVKAILRRSMGVSIARIEIGALQIDPRRHEVRINHHLVKMTLKEFELLHLMASHPGRVFSREELLERVWGYSYLGNTRTVDVHINRLRHKLAEEGLCDDLICTEWGAGYKLELPALKEAAVGGSGDYRALNSWQYGA